MIPRPQPAPPQHDTHPVTYVYLLPVQQQRRWAKPALLLMTIALILICSCAAWPYWYVRDRLVNGTSEATYLTSTGLCVTDNSTHVQGCWSYREKFGSMPSMVAFFWAGLVHMMVCLVFAIAGTLWFLCKAQNPDHLRLAFYALQPTVLSIIPYFALRSWTGEYLGTTSRSSGGIKLYMAAFTFVIAACVYMVFSTRRLRNITRDESNTEKLVSIYCPYYRFSHGLLRALSKTTASKVTSENQGTSETQAGSSHSSSRLPPAKRKGILTPPHFECKRQEMDTTRTSSFAEAVSSLRRGNLEEYFTPDAASGRSLGKPGKRVSFADTVPAGATGQGQFRDEETEW